MFDVSCLSPSPLFIIWIFQYSKFLFMLMRNGRWFLVLIKVWALNFANFALQLEGSSYDEEQMQILNLKGSVVDIAHDYAKRKHVFRLTTVNGSEYLFQVWNFISLSLFCYTFQPFDTHQAEPLNICSPSRFLLWCMFARGSFLLFLHSYLS